MAYSVFTSINVANRWPGMSALEAASSMIVDRENCPSGAKGPRRFYWVCAGDKSPAYRTIEFFRNR
jgi:hypothetical protein